MAEIKELTLISARPAMRMALTRHEKATAYAEMLKGDDHAWTASDTVKTIGKRRFSEVFAGRHLLFARGESFTAMLAFASFALR
jgi:hypothetical protein